MKKGIIILSLIMCIFVFFSCDNNEKKETGTTVGGETTQSPATPATSDSTPLATPTPTVEPDPTVLFREHINNGEYVKAAALYNEKMLGNMRYELSAVETIVAVLNEIDLKILAGEAKKSDADVAVNTVEKVIEETDIYVEDYEEVRNRIEGSLVSKAAFVSGNELKALANYADAIKEFSKVIEKDSNYAAAQTIINECKTAYKAEKFAKAESLATSKRYSEAITVLKEMLAVISEDEEISSKISVYSITHIRSAITDAETAFVDIADYDKALAHINGALQFYPDNEELIEKKDYYNSFAPVKLAARPKFETSGKYGPAFMDSEKDLLGNQHTDVFRTWSYMYETAYVVYMLNGNYNKLTFNVYGTIPSDNSTVSVSVRDYSKGDYDQSTVLYLNENVKCGAFPFQVEIDVTGVQMIRIYVEYGVAVADGVLQRTVK